MAVKVTDKRLKGGYEPVVRDANLIVLLVSCRTLCGVPFKDALFTLALLDHHEIIYSVSFDSIALLFSSLQPTRDVHFTQLDFASAWSVILRRWVGRESLFALIMIDCSVSFLVVFFATS